MKLRARKMTRKLLSVLMIPSIAITMISRSSLPIVKLKSVVFLNILKKNKIERCCLVKKNENKEVAGNDFLPSLTAY